MSVSFKHTLFLSVLIFFIGGIGGIFFDRLFIPAIGNLWPFSVMPPSPSLTPQISVVQKKEEIIIRENEALENMIEKTLRSVVKIEVESGGKIVKEGTGTFVTNDGMVLTPYDVVKIGTPYVRVNGTRHEAKVFNKNQELNLAALVIGDGRFPAVSFGDFSKLKLGERVFLLGVGKEEAGSFPFAMEGIVKSLQGELFQVSFFDSSVHGAPLFTIEGNVVGLSFVEGKDLFVLSISTIRSFLGF